MFIRAVKYCGDFLKLNSIPEPKYIRNDSIDAHGLYVKQNARSVIMVNVKGSSCPVKVPGHSWSFPCNKADLTVIGITAHETGHHIAYEFGSTKISNNFKKITTIEPKVSSYEPSVHEAFAEAMKLFINNPELLREGRPGRWAFITQYVGLKPMHSIPWKKVLKEAHPRLIDVAERWIEHDL